MDWKKITILLSILLIGSGCSITSPIMLETQVAKSKSNALPYTVGIGQIEKKGSQKLTDIKTYQTLALLQISGRMPRRSEADYYNKSLVNALRGNGIFSYVYGTPFDKDDVDLRIDVELKNFKIENSSYGTIINHINFIPGLNLASLGVLIGIVPQEYFSGEWTILYHLKNRHGKLIKTYKDEQSFGDFVIIWEQPFASYTWYESEWLKLFNSSLNKLQADIRKDAALISGKLK